MIHVVFDIETVAKAPSKEEEDRFIDTWEPPKNYKDEEKIAAKRATDFKSWKRKRSFEVGGARPISIAFGVPEDGEIKHLECKTSDNPEDLAKFSAEYLNELGQVKLVGFNSSNFDLPLFTHLLATNNQPLRYKIGKWDSVDLWMFPLGKKGTLKGWCEIYGIEQEDSSVHGGKIAELYKNEDWDTIKAYNMDDVRITGELFLKLSYVFQL